MRKSLLYGSDFLTFKDSKFYKAMISVGINEGVILQKVELTEKEGKYSLDFSFGDGNDATVSDNPFDEELDENGMVVVNSSTNSIKLWPVMAPKDEDTKGNLLSPQQKYDIVFKEINEQKNLLIQCASCYVTSDKLVKEVEGKKVSIIDLYRGIAMTRENMHSMLPNNEILQRVFKNMAEDFVSFMSPILATEQTPLRVLLVRQSAAKHYASFRRRFIREQPVFELAAIPKEASKLKFSDYEIQKGLNDGTPIQQAAADPAAAPAANLNEANVFGG
jgi:hypothetical protein